MRARRNEKVGGGYFVFARGSRTGRIKTGHILHGAVPFEHPNYDSAVREAERLSAIHGREFFVLGDVDMSLASDLLDAAKLALSIIEGFEPENGGIASDDDIATIRAAIARATGAA